ncbi:serine/threonine-protein kinase ATR isoform X2 [Cephus cinctus]|uniref:non-specific serine/threonine protein kinase n=1 Tax=Cephus cinctus TaxID=211228 RepID=A0AAJ7RNP1_CEPCN|nr:serine/threonine-protein kinase ATR isoform X2 [Cephus cinctus]
MEVEDTSESSQTSNSVKVTETVWQFINNPIKVILADLGNSATEQTLIPLLESILRGSSNLVNILVPPKGTGPNYDLFQEQYTAFTTWLFGTMFYIIGSPVSDDVLQLSIEVQACVIHILYRHHLVMFHRITSEYMTILDVLLNFNDDQSEPERIVVSQFKPKSDVTIENLDLTPFSVEILRNRISSALISILKIILKTDATLWDRSKLWDNIFRILGKSAPEVKVFALDVATEIVKFCNDGNKNRISLINYTIEIAKTIPAWKTSGDLSTDSLSHFSTVLIKFINNLNESLSIMDLCFEIIDMIYYDNFTELKSLEVAACTKIKECFLKYPVPCDNMKKRKFFQYLEYSSNFAGVLIYFVYEEIKIATRTVQGMMNLSELSDLWNALKKFLMLNVDIRKLDKSCSILESSRLLDSWITENNIRVQLYGSDLQRILENFLNTLSSESNHAKKAVFENMMHLMAHREANRLKIQEVLALPWTKDLPSVLKIDKSTLAVAKCLNVSTKVKYIEILCEFGTGNWRIELLRTCVTNCEVELAVAAIQNSILLIRDPQINLEDINENILNYALNSQKQKLQEALGNVLGHGVCFLSGRARIAKQSQHDTQWTIVCKDCDKKASNVTGKFAKVQNSCDRLLQPYFKLLTSNFTEVRLCMSRNFLRFSNHAKSFNSIEIANLWSTYIHDDNDEIRANVAKVIGAIFQNKITLSYIFNDLYENIQIQLEDNIPSDLEDFVDLIIAIMRDTLTKALELPNTAIHETLLDTAREFVRVPCHLTERRTLNIFLITILHPNSSSLAIALATMAYQQIAESRKVSLKSLYVRYKKDFLRLIMRSAVYNYIEYSYNMATTLHRLAKCIGFQGSRQLLRKDGHHAVCFLLPLIVQEPKASPLLHDIAELITMDEKQMFSEYFQYICPYILLNESSMIGAQCFKLISESAETSIADLTTRSFMGIFNELLLNFHKDVDKVIEYLEMISKFDLECKGRFDTQESLATYLSPRFHGVLVNLDLNLGPRSDEYTQQSALVSLTVLIRFMGPSHITPLRYKILATLRTSLSFKRPGFRRLACEAWDAFLHNVFIKDLGPLLLTICVSLITLLEIYPDKVNAMLEYLIVQNKRLIADNIAELFFIDDIKTTENISQIVRNLSKKAIPSSMEDNLKLWLKRITHETEEVRLKALIHLQKFLSEHRTGINELILNDTDVHPLIVELLDHLLAGCQDKNENIRLAYGECIGELGAVEPSLLPRRIVSRADSKFIVDMDEEFACATLFELVRAFQAQKSTQSMDCFSLAIQEILKTYGISPHGNNKYKWRSLPVTMQQMITPFLTSHYKITTGSENIQQPHPIYGSEAGSTFEKWAYNWVCSMCDSVRQIELANIINACRPAFRRDIKTLIFCMPYIICHIVANGTENERKKLTEEMMAVISGKEFNKLDQELLRRRPLRHKYVMESGATRISDEARRVRCSQVVFSILDHLQRWLRERRMYKNSKFATIKDFCNKLDSLVLAEGCYQSHEYHRALIYLEQHMTKNSKGLSEIKERGLLAKIYAQLEDLDGVSGILATQDQSPTLQQLVLAHEISGQLQDAAMCYEKLAQEKNLKPAYLQGMVQCYLDLDQPFTAMNITEGVLNSRPELEILMVEHESFWRLAHFSRLDDAKQKTVKCSLLKNLKSGVKPNLQNLKKKLVSLIGATSHQGAYQQSYSYITKLHILNEFEKATEMMLENVENLPAIFEEWEKRSQLIHASRGVEFVLGMRRASLDLAVQLHQESSQSVRSTLREEIGKIWLKSAKIARKAGLYQQAYTYILSAMESCPPQELYIEQAQLYWQKGCQEEAFTTLKRCFASCFQPVGHYKELPSGTSIEERRQCAKAKLLFAKYNDETLNVDTDGNIANYKEVVEVWRGWEKGLLCCALYFETIVDKMTDEEKDIKGRDLQIHMMNNYGKSLQYGCKYVHQSIPRMLTIWLDYGSRAQTHSSTMKSRLDTLLKMTRIMDVYFDRLPAFIWLTAFSQLVSRICHPAKEVQNTLCFILVKLIVAYPQHCLWMMASVFKSSYPMRQRRCQEILNHPKLKTPELYKLVQDFDKLWERLIELSNKNIPEGTNTASITTLSKTLPRLLAGPNYSAIMMPTTKFRQLHLPIKANGFILLVSKTLSQ